VGALQARALGDLEPLAAPHLPRCSAAPFWRAGVHGQQPLFQLHLLCGPAASSLHAETSAPVPKQL